ncbi:MAG: hypothetical protein BAA02_07815 [Paenibacillaceae bacterium ZCTH02-B3]|nr:MAG: hypothetical protein BAA02_07815 [Paenibacillaceae bacterium ZCTH02-B3]
MPRAAHRSRARSTFSPALTTITSRVSSSGNSRRICRRRLSALFRRSFHRRKGVATASTAKSKSSPGSPASHAMNPPAASKIPAMPAPSAIHRASRSFPQSPSRNTSADCGRSSIGCRRVQTAGVSSQCLTGSVQSAGHAPERRKRRQAAQP